MKPLMKFITDVPYAKTESERIKYAIMRATAALFTTIFLVSLVSLKISDVVLSSNLSAGLEIIWGISCVMFFGIWVIVATPYYAISFAVWAVGFSAASYILITVSGSESSVYRSLIFTTVSLLIMSAFLRRIYLYTVAFGFYAVVLFAIYRAGLATPGFIFPVTIVWAFSVAAIELITRIRQAEERIIAQERARALHSSRLSTLGETTAFLVHEVSSPLTILNGHLELIQKKENIDYHLGKMHNALGRALDFITSVKKMVRANEPNEYEIVQLSEIFKLVSDLVEPSLSRKNIRLEFEYTEDLELKCRPAEIAQVLINLINNSADAIGSGRERWIRVSSKETEGGCVEIEVSDPGSGIDFTLANRVMEPFFTTKTTGSGIGLSIAQQVASHHDGRIDIVKFKDPTMVRMRIALVPSFVRSGKETKLDL